MYRYRKPLDVQIDDGDPFRHDKLSRRNFAESLRAVVRTLTQPVVVAVNGPWGTGKTTFLRMWLPTLKTDGHQCVYFNAWENDYASDPLIGLLAAVQQQVTPAKKSKVWTRTKKLASSVARTVAPAAIKLLTYNALNLEEIKKAVSDSEADTIADFVHDAAEKQIDEHVKSVATVAAFREALAAFATEITQHLDGATRSLVIVVDELDRCRPTFAIETLERIKHLFNVPNVVFVLALDLAQLSFSVKSLYGEGMDAENYLRRFIDLVCDLPIASSREFCDYLYHQFELAEVISEGEREFIVDLFSGVSDAYRLPLRAQEQLFAQVAVVSRLLYKRSFGAVELAILLVILRTVNLELYRGYLGGFRRGNDVLDYFAQRPEVAKVIKAWPVIDVLLEGYSLVEGEKYAAYEAAQAAAKAEEQSAEQRHRAEWKAGLLRSADIPTNALIKTIGPALDFTATVRRA